MSKKSIVITGCSSGFGHRTALALAEMGWLVFATIRKEMDKDSLLREAEQRHCVDNLIPILCDITNDEHITALAAEVEQRLRAEQTTTHLPERMPPALDALLNNAGTAYGGPIELMLMDDVRAQFEINVFAHVAVTQALLPMIKVAHGMIINVSSISGKIAVPITGMYSASKYALEAISDALRVEIAPFGVRVVVIEPASSPTNIWETSSHRALGHLEGQRDAGAYARLLRLAEKFAQRSSRSGFHPQKFTDLVIYILNSPSPRPRYGVPFSATFQMTLRHVLPDRIWDKLIRLALRW
ncbi:MAG TPA: SDR family oxidoreductase [Dictyobacter sp.]|nr:SDR family oxidoreductase [Dictyobacter sp.]